MSDKSAQDERRKNPSLPTFEGPVRGLKKIIGGGRSRTAKSCGPDAPMLASRIVEGLSIPTGCEGPQRLYKSTVAQHGRRGDHEVSRHIHCAGKGRVSRLNLSVACARTSFSVACEAAGAACTRLSLRPLFSLRRTN